MTVLYHYCSTASFQAIINSSSLWLSSLSLSNDTTEGKLVAASFARLAKEDQLSDQNINRLQQSLEVFEKILDGLGFCLSTEGDLLSQWRGYADDAAGVAIGFNSDYLNWLAEESVGKNEPGFSVQKVEYEPEEHDRRIKPTYEKIKEYINAGAFKTPGRRTLLDTRSDEEVEQESNEIRQALNYLSSTLVLSLFGELFRLKSKGFREEHEWRLLSYMTINGTEPCLFRTLHDRVVPYRVFEMKGLKEEAISEIILGPKHNTPVHIVESFLKLNNFGHVQIKSSETSYR